jgi:hypothetical protein
MLLDIRRLVALAGLTAELLEKRQRGESVPHGMIPVKTIPLEG